MTKNWFFDAQCPNYLYNQSGDSLPRPFTVSVAHKDNWRMGRGLGILTVHSNPCVNSTGNLKQMILQKDTEIETLKQQMQEMQKKCNQANNLVDDLKKKQKGLEVGSEDFLF